MVSFRSRCALVFLLMAVGLSLNAGTVFAQQQVDKVRAERARNEMDRETKLKQAAAFQLSAESLGSVHADEIEAYMTERWSEMESAVQARLAENAALVASQGREAAEVAIRTEVDREYRGLATQAMLEVEAKALAAETHRFLAENSEEVEQFLAAKVEQARRLAGNPSNFNEQSLREQLVRELTANVNRGIQSGRTEVRARKMGLNVVARHAQEAIEAERFFTDTLSASLSEDAWSRMKTAHDQMQALTLRLEVLARNYQELEQTARQARAALAAGRLRMQSFRAELDEWSTKAAGQAEQLLTDGDVDGALHQLQEAARLNPDDHGLVQRIVAVQQANGRAGSQIYVNGKALAAQPRLIEGRNLVPLRAMAEALGAEVFWEPINRVVTFTRGDSFVKLKIDSNKVQVNGQEIIIDVPAQIFDDRTHVPLRAVSEMLHAEVGYDPETRAVTVVDPIL